MQLAVASSDAASAVALLAAHARSELSEAELALEDAVVDFDADEATCPACSTTFSTELTRCPDCGLNFG